VSLRKLVVLVFWIYDYSMCLCWENGFGVWIPTNEGFGKRLLNQNGMVGGV